MRQIFLKTLLFTAALFMLLMACSNAQPPKKNMAAGDPVPRFSLPDQDGKIFKVADYIGKKVMVFYFYPKDESMVCTKEACAFRDSFNEFTKAGAIVVGINAGTVASHKSFQQHYKLPFILLSDPDNKVYTMFGVKTSMFMPGRETFVVNLKGKIVYTHTAMLQGKTHADDALEFIRKSVE